MGINTIRSDKRYYVYEWHNKDTGVVFYVGKGTGRRFKVVDGRNEYFKRYLNKHNCDVRKVRIKLSEEDAYRLEKELIAKYKSKNQCMCNFHEGGQGGSVENSSDETMLLRDTAFLVNNSRKLIGENQNKPFCLSVSQEIAVTYTFQQFGLSSSEQYYSLGREDKIRVAKSIADMVEESEYNGFVKDLVEDGGYFSFDDYWEQNG